MQRFWHHSPKQSENTMTTEPPKKWVAQRLLEVCSDYIEHHELTCAESIYQKDAIYESAPELVEQICNVIGYYPSGDDEQ